MIKLKNLLLENQSHLVISIPKPNSQENAERRLNHQYAFGEVGIGPKVYAATSDGIYISDFAKGQPIAKSGGDIMAKMKEIYAKANELGVEMFDDKVENIWVSGDDFQIIDAGGSQVSGNLKSYKAPITQATKQDLINYIKSNRIPNKKIGEGEMRVAYAIDPSIMGFFNK